MMMKLQQDDALAVDLLLEHGMDASASARMGSVDPDAVNRIGLAESVLRIFGQMPAGDPPRDLVDRTVTYVYSRTMSQVTPDYRPNLGR